MLEAIKAIVPVQVALRASAAYAFFDVSSRRHLWCCCGRKSLRCWNLAFEAERKIVFRKFLPGNVEYTCNKNVGKRFLLFQPYFSFSWCGSAISFRPAFFFFFFHPMNAFRNGGDDEAKNAVLSANPAADRFSRPRTHGKRTRNSNRMEGFLLFLFSDRSSFHVPESSWRRGNG